MEFINGSIYVDLNASCGCMCNYYYIKSHTIMVKIKTWPNRPEDCQNHILGFLLNLSAECS